MWINKNLSFLSYTVILFCKEKRMLKIESFYLEQTRFILWLPVFFMWGILFYFSLQQEPSSFHITICSFLVFGLFFYLHSVRDLHIVLYPFLFFCLGFFIIFSKTHVLETHMLKKSLKNIHIHGVVEEIDFIPEKNKQKITINLHEENDFSIQKVKLTYKRKNAKQLNIGDIIDGDATLLPFTNPVSLFSYNFKRDAYFKSIGASGYLKDIQVLDSQEKHYFKKLRYNISSFLRKNLKGQTAEIANAIIVGVKSGISSQTQEAFSASGLSHILAISGLHISLVAGIIFIFFRKGLSFFSDLTRRKNSKKIACFLVPLPTLFYVALSGFGYPAIRAFCMLFIFCVGVIYDRFPVSMRTVAFAAMVVLILFPESAVSISFQLSFSAVIGLVAFYEATRDWFYRAHEYLNQYSGGFLIFYLLGVVVTTLVATLSTLPISIYYFYQFSITAVLANLLAIPLTAFFIMPAAVIAIVSYFLYPSDFLLFPLGSSIDILQSIAQFVSQMPGSKFFISQPSNLYLILFSIGFLWICLFATRLRHLGCIFIVGAFIMLFDKSHLPDIYIAENGRNIAFLENNKLYFFNKADTFFVRQWQKEQGGIESNYLEKDYVTSGKVMFIYNPWDKDLSSIAEVKNVNWIITNGYIKGDYLKNIDKKNTKILINRSDIKKTGGVFVWSDSLRIIGMNNYLGNRPWL